jgi:hypothetical protein
MARWWMQEFMNRNDRIHSSEKAGSQRESISKEKHGNVIEDAEEKMLSGAGDAANVPLPSADGRKARVRR